MKSGNFYLFDKSDDFAIVTLNRPAVKNAFHAEMIAELTALFKSLNEQSELKAAFLRAEGNVFCAGADLGGMKAMKNFGPKENEQDALALAGLFAAIRGCSLPVVGLVQGGCFGGGVGIVAACDLAIAHGTKATFCLSEIKLGLIPAVISPYVVSKIGVTHFRHYALTAEVIDASSALSLGLISHVIKDEEDLLAAAKKYLAPYAAGAMREVKALAHHLENQQGLFTGTMQQELASWIARVRVGAEAQEGMSALLEKRAPNWKRNGNYLGPS